MSREQLKLQIRECRAEIKKLEILNLKKQIEKCHAEIKKLKLLTSTKKIETKEEKIERLIKEINNIQELINSLDQTGTSGLSNKDLLDTLKITESNLSIELNTALNKELDKDIKKNNFNIGSRSKFTNSFTSITKSKNNLKIDAAIKASLQSTKFNPDPELDAAIKASLQSTKFNSDPELDAAIEESKKSLLGFRQQEYMQQVIAESLGMKVIEENSDGNCLFRALARYIENNPNKHNYMRNYICNNLKEVINKKFNGLITDEYVDNMRQDKVYGGQEEIYVFSNKFKVTVHVYNITTGEKTTITPEIVDLLFEDLHLSYIRNNHYNTFEPK